jgi:hypothetical protein
MIFAEHKTAEDLVYSAEGEFGTITITSVRRIDEEYLDAILAGVLQSGVHRSRRSRRKEVACQTL